MIYMIYFQHLPIPHPSLVRQEYICLLTMNNQSRLNS